MGQGLLGHHPSEGQKFSGPELLGQGGEMSTPKASKALEPDTSCVDSLIPQTGTDAEACPGDST